MFQAEAPVQTFDLLYFVFVNPEFLQHSEVLKTSDAPDPVSSEVQFSEVGGSLETLDVLNEILI